MEKARNIEGKQTDHGWNRLAGVLMQLLNVVILVALGERIMRPEYNFVVDEETEEVRRVEVGGSVRRKVRCSTRAPAASSPGPATGGDLPVVICEAPSVCMMSPCPPQAHYAFPAQSVPALGSR